MTYGHFWVLDHWSPGEYLGFSTLHLPLILRNLSLNQPYRLQYFRFSPRSWGNLHWQRITSGVVDLVKGTPCPFVLLPWIAFAPNEIEQHFLHRSDFHFHSGNDESFCWCFVDSWCTKVYRTWSSGTWSLVKPGKLSPAVHNYSTIGTMTYLVALSGQQKQDDHRFWFWKLVANWQVRKVLDQYWGSWRLHASVKDTEPRDKIKYLVVLCGQHKMRKIKKEIRSRRRVPVVPLLYNPLGILIIFIICQPSAGNQR